MTETEKLDRLRRKARELVSKIERIHSHYEKAAGEDTEALRDDLAIVHEKIAACVADQFERLATRAD